MGVKMENSSSPLLLLRNLIIAPLFLSSEKPLKFIFSHKSKFFHVLRTLFVSIFLLIFHLVHSFTLYLPFYSTIIGKYRNHDHHDHDQLMNNNTHNTAIGRAIYHLLSLVNSIPTSSRKYEIVRSLAEKLIDENVKDGSETLKRVNCVVLSDAFGKTMNQLEAALLDQDSNQGFGIGPGPSGFGLGRVVRVAKGWYKAKEDGGPALEKMAAELMWLAQKLEESGGAEVAVEKWASARSLGWVALAAESRVQASLVKLTAFLIKHAKNMGKEQQTGHQTEQKQIKMKMLTTWLPLLCQASNGTDAPTLSISERAEIERTLEEIIDMIEDEENREQVLSLWLHHFAHCSSSDWPNLYGSYMRWCSVARNLLLING